MSPLLPPLFLWVYHSDLDLALEILESKGYFHVHRNLFYFDSSVDGVKGGAAYVWALQEDPWDGWAEGRVTEKKDPAKEGWVLSVGGNLVFTRTLQHKDVFQERCSLQIWCDQQKKETGHWLGSLGGNSLTNPSCLKCSWASGRFNEVQGVWPL